MKHIAIMAALTLGFSAAAHADFDGTGAQSLFDDSFAELQDAVSQTNERIQERASSASETEEEPRKEPVLASELLSKAAQSASTAGTLASRAYGAMLSATAQDRLSQARDAVDDANEDMFKALWVTYKSRLWLDAARRMATNRQCALVLLDLALAYDDLGNFHSEVTKAHGIGLRAVNQPLEELKAGAVAAGERLAISPSVAWSAADRLKGLIDQIDACVPEATLQEESR